MQTKELSSAATRDRWFRWTLTTSAGRTVLRDTFRGSFGVSFQSNHGRSITFQVLGLPDRPRLAPMAFEIKSFWFRKGPIQYIVTSRQVYSLIAILKEARRHGVKLYFTYRVVSMRTGCER